MSEKFWLEAAASINGPNQGSVCGSVDASVSSSVRQVVDRWFLIFHQILAFPLY